jgi:hypothetical protein
VTQPVFIVGSGRCGTFALAQVLDQVEGVDAYHEYNVLNMQKLGCLLYTGQILPQVARNYLEQQWYGPAIHYSQSRVWVDSSNKISWLLKPLIEAFPDARFIWLIRDGRQVCSSYFNKLADEHYDDEAVGLLAAWLRDPARVKQPPLEKRYWWPMPGERIGIDEFLALDRWQRVCWHWAIINHQIKQAVGDRAMKVKLEDIMKKRGDISWFMGIDSDPFLWEQLRRPRNVNQPVNFPLTFEQQVEYWDICGEMHIYLGYGDEEPEPVDYG